MGFLPAAPIILYLLSRRTRAGALRINYKIFSIIYNSTFIVKFFFLAREKALKVGPDI
jgi:hypothetical protein